MISIQSEEYIIARDFDSYFAITPTAADRLDALEAAITELAEVMTDG